MTQRCGYCDEPLPPVMRGCKMIDDDDLLACEVCIDIYQAELAARARAREQCSEEPSGGA